MECGGGVVCKLWSNFLALIFVRLLFATELQYCHLMSQPNLFRRYN